MDKERIVPFRLSPAKALAKLRAIASNPSNVEVTRHAISRMAERNITDAQMHSCLRRGHLNETPTVNDQGMWKFGVEVYVAGDHLSCAVVIDPLKPSVLVITAFWIQ